MKLPLIHHGVDRSQSKFVRVLGGDEGESTSMNCNVMMLFDLLHYQQDLRRFKILIPNTIAFNNLQTNWYFSSIQDQRILRKNSYNITIEKIMKEFQKELPNFSDEFQSVRTGKAKRLKRKKLWVDDGLDLGPNIVAVVYQWKEDIAGNMQLSYDALNVMKLQKILEQRKRDSMSSGFIQQFVPPVGDFDSLIRVNYTNRVCLVEQLVNRNKLGDNSLLLKERWACNPKVTNLGPSISTHLHVRLTKFCKSLEKHIVRATDSLHTVRSMSFNLKLDKHGQIWFLNFQTLKTVTMPSSAIIKNFDYCLDPTLIPLKGKLFSIKQGHDDLKCIICHKTYDSAIETFLSYDTIIRSFENKSRRDLRPNPLYRKKKRSRSTIRPEIPPLIHLLEPTITLEEFKELKLQDSFLYKTLRCCDFCYDDAMKGLSGSLLSSETRIKRKFKKLTGRMHTLSLPKKSKPS